MNAPSSSAELVRELKAAIEGETAALTRLIESLREEQDGIISGPPAALQDAVKRKIAAYDEVEKVRERRHRAMAMARLPRDPVAVERRLAAHRELSAGWKTLRGKARDASVLNSLNAKLVANRLQMVSERIDALRKAHGRGPIYDATGKRDEGAGGRVIASV